jgi:hypothetical protein
MKHLVALSTVIVALALTAPGARAQTEPRSPAQQVPAAENQPYCLQRAGTLECIYRTLAECTKDRAGEASGCVPNPRLPTGAGSPMPRER